MGDPEARILRTGRLTLRTATATEGWILRRQAPLVRWLPVVWLVITFIAMFDLRGNAVDLGAGVTLQNMVEFGVYVMVGGLAADVWVRLLRKGIRDRLGTGLSLLALLSGLFFVSSLWADGLFLTAARGLQAIGVAILAYVSMRLWRDGYRNLADDWRTYWLGYCAVVAAFSVGGLLYPNWIDGRFGFPFVHPVDTGALLSIALVAAISMTLEPVWFLSRSRIWWLRVFIVFVTALLLITRTRSALFGLAAGVAILFWRWSRRREGLRPLIWPGVVISVVLAGVYFFSPIWKFILRDQTTEQFSGATGRWDLIEPAIDYFRANPIWGLGHSAGRTVFLDEFEWAGHGHNLLIELGVDLGVIGLVVGVLLGLWVGVAAWLLHDRVPSHISHLVLGWYCVSVAFWVADPGYALVGHAFSMIALVIAAMSAEFELNPQPLPKLLAAVERRRSTVRAGAEPGE